MLRLELLGLTSLIVPLAMAAAAGCSSPRHPTATPAAVPGPEVVLSPAGAPAVTVAVEVARAPSELEHGLMYRTALEPDHGMIFLFAKPEKQTFWMHNTYIALDMIFIGADHKVVGVVENAEPLTDSPRFVDGLSQYVLEVTAGWAAAHRIAPGTPVQFNRFAD